MKKNFYFAVIILAVIFIAAGSLAQAETLEKILTPGAIKNYQGVIKRDGSLYGVKLEKLKPRLIATSTLSADLNVNQEESSTVSKKLEKIAAPSVISLYENIKKIGTALWGIRKNEPAKSAVVTAETSACVAAAINVKDQALIEKINTTATALNAAITTRSTCQQAAVQTTTNQRQALETCVKTFTQAHKELNTTAKKSQQTLWETYRVSLKACRPTATSTTSISSETQSGQGEIMISDGSDNILDTVTNISTQE